MEEEHGASGWFTHEDFEGASVGERQKRSRQVVHRSTPSLPVGLAPCGARPIVGSVVYLRVRAGVSLPAWFCIEYGRGVRGCQPVCPRPIHVLFCHNPTLWRMR